MARDRVSQRKPFAFATAVSDSSCPASRARQPLSLTDQPAYPAPRASRGVSRVAHAIRWLLILWSAGGWLFTANAQNADETAVKAVFLLRFGSFVNWPPSTFPNPDSPLVMCFVGGDDLAGRVSEAAAGEPAGGRRVVVVRLNSTASAATCHILYAGGMAAQSVAAVLRSAGGSSVLTVTDQRNGDTRGMIHFVVADRRVRFHIDRVRSRAVRSAHQFAASGNRAQRQRVECQGRAMKRPSRIPYIDLPRHTTTLAVVITAILLAAGVTSAWVGEQDFRSQKVQQAEAHANVLAASVSAALAFEEAPEAEQAISALRANSDVQAVGVYRFDGVPFALGSDDAHQPPASLSGPPEALFEGDSAIATALVVQEGQELGRVYVRLAASAGAAQWMRYVGVGLLLVMAAILVGAITISQLSLSAANMRLGRQAATLTEANEKLVNEMRARKKAERALAQSQKMEAIGQLTGGLAHDFNNILAAVSGGVRLLERSKDADRREQVRAGIAEAIERGARLTRQLLTFARGQNTEARIVDPCGMIGSMLEMLRRSIGEDVDVDASIAASSWHVQVDPNQFELVLLNLAVNARDAMPNGGRISITCQNVERMDTPAGEFVRVTIADTGTGMSPETIERAFEPFFTTKEVGKGTGLGLAQVYWLCATVRRRGLD